MRKILNIPTKEELIELNKRSEETHKFKYLKDTLEQNYTCLRGPRASGALLHIKYQEERVTKNGNRYIADVDEDIFGGVFPSKNSLSCKDKGECLIIDGHCKRNLHAEVDAIMNALLQGYKVKDSTLYSWNKPCYECSIFAIKAGVVRIVYRYVVYNEEKTQQAIQNAGIICEKYEGYIGE